jgi:hypothetical protein
MSSKNPISFAFSVLFEIAAVVAIVSVLPRINLRPSVSASQSPSQTLPLQLTDLRTQPQQSWINASRSYDQPTAPSAPPFIEATPANPQYVEQQLDRASQRLLNSVGGAVNQASQDWLRPIPPQTTPIGTSQPPTYPPQNATYPPQNEFSTLPPAQQTTAKQTAQKPTNWPTATQKPTAEPRPWLRY